MIEWFTSLIRQIVGRLKQNMSALFLALGMMFVPLGFYLLVEGNIGVWYARITVILGIVCQIIAYLYARYDQKKEDFKYLTQYTLTKESSEKLITEIRGLRQDIKEVSDGGKQQKPKTKL
jgi:hypothetical protein